MKPKTLLWNFHAQEISSIAYLMGSFSVHVNHILH